MRIAVMSDVHGFSIALERVLAHIEANGPFDAVLIAGDLCEVGPAPGEVLDLVRGQDAIVIQGNTDFDIVEAARMGDSTPSLRYAIEQIGPAGVDYLAALPFSHRISPPGGHGPENDLLVVHANPRNLLDRLDPAMSDRELRETMGDERPGAIAFGHFHVCYTRRVDDTLLVDVSAVGNPKDGDLRCKYGVLSWNAEKREWDGEIVKLDYPLEATEQQILASGLPNPEKVLKKLKKASY